MHIQFSAAEPPMYQDGGQGAVANRGSDAFEGVGPHIAGGEHVRQAGF
jgi:hypothetical protein